MAMQSGSRGHPIWWVACVIRSRPTRGPHRIFVRVGCWWYHGQSDVNPRVVQAVANVRSCLCAGVSRAARLSTVT